MLARLCTEINNKLGLHDAIPVDDYGSFYSIECLFLVDRLRMTFGELLEKSSAKQRTVLILDALDQVIHIVTIIH